MSSVAILLTSFNRKENTLACLKSIYSQTNKLENKYTVFLVIDGSTDGTYDAVKEFFPEVNIILGDGTLFWAGGMRLCFTQASKSDQDFDHYLLLNDDTILFEDALDILLNDKQTLKRDEFILIGSTQGKNSVIGNFTYGGRVLLNKYNSSSKIVLPNDESPQICHLGNANIMLIPCVVIKKIGFLSHQYTHAIADFEYTLRARKHGIKSYIASKYLGICNINDNQVINWKRSNRSTLKERIEFLFSAKGLAYNEYLSYIKHYFPFYLPQAWFLLWAKTLFPIFWDKLKKRRSI